MAEKDKISETKVKHEGLFDFKETYRFLYTLLTDMEYTVEEKGYVEKVKPTGKEVEISWDVERKISDYFKYKMSVRWLILGMTSKEVVKEGMKTKMNKGVLEIKFACFLEKDYENRWETTAFLKFLRGIYDNYVIRGRIDDYEDKVFSEMTEVAEQLKAFLALEAKR